MPYVLHGVGGSTAGNCAVGIDHGYKPSSAADAVAFAVTSHFVLLCAFIVLGILALSLTGIGWRSITNSSEEQGEIREEH